jgi:hypothetical protein
VFQSLPAVGPTFQKNQGASRKTRGLPEKPGGFQKNQGASRKNRGLGKLWKDVLTFLVG